MCCAQLLLGHLVAAGHRLDQVETPLALTLPVAVVTCCKEVEEGQMQVDTCISEEGHMELTCWYLGVDGHEQ